jgi:hypothetical protein
MAGERLTFLGPAFRRRSREAPSFNVKGVTKMRVDEYDYDAGYGKLQFADPGGKSALRAAGIIILGAALCWASKAPAQEIPIDCWVNNERDLPPGSNSVGEYCGFADGSVIRQLCADPHNINTRYCADPHGILAKGHEARANAREIPSEEECLLSQWCSYENNVDNLNDTRCHALYPKEMDGETYREVSGPPRRNGIVYEAFCVKQEKSAAQAAAASCARYSALTTFRKIYGQQAASLIDARAAVEASDYGRRAEKIYYDNCVAKSGAGSK